MGNGMNKVLPNLYVGNYRDSKDINQLAMHGITHILAIHDNPKHLFPEKHYLCVMAADAPDQDLSQFFPVCNDFIHGARLRKDCNVLIHCLAGMSRSVTIAVAYVMSISNLNWRDGLRVIRVGRKIANPNSGFQIQLQDFENNKVVEERRRMKERFPSLALVETDLDYIYRALEHFDRLITTRDLCHFNCKRNENCPTGVCRMNHDQKYTGGIFRRRPSSASTSGSRLSINSQSGSASCPTSPRKHLPVVGLSSANFNEALTSSSHNFHDGPRYHHGLHRSPSANTTYNYRQNSSYTPYTGPPSAPVSANTSRVDLSNIGRPSGSVIYLGKTNSSNTGSRLSLVSRSSSLSSPHSSPSKHRPRQ